MNRDEVRRRAYERMSDVEEKFADRDLPRSVLNYYLLVKLIWLGDLDAFIHEHGEYAIRPNSAAEGKRLLGLGVLSPFERETCDLLSGEVDAEPDRHDSRGIYHVGIRHASA